MAKTLRDSSSSKRAVSPSSVNMERLMVKSNKKQKGKRKNTSVFIKIALAVVALVVASGSCSFLSLSTNLHNSLSTADITTTAITTTTPNSVKPSDSILTHISPADTQKWTAMNGHRVKLQTKNGNMFAQAHTLENGKKVDQSNLNQNGKVAGITVIDPNNAGNFHSAQQQPPQGQNFAEKQGTIAPKYQYQYKYYYYDSTLQAFHLNEQYPSIPDKATSTTTNFQNSLGLSGRYQPALCKDGYTYGFSDLGTLQNAIHELSDAYAQAVSQWKIQSNAIAEHDIITFHYGNSHAIDVETPPPLPQHFTNILETEPDPFVICPHTTLKAPLGRHMTINVNAEDVIVKCDACVIDAPGTHFTFGPLAKNVLIKGVTLTGATETSLVFRNDGADVSFEDCYWVNNESNSMHGAVADMNMTSSVKFYRCEMSDKRVSPRAPGAPGQPGGMVTSLTLRSG